MRERKDDAFGQRREDSAIDYSLHRSPIEAKLARMCSMFVLLCRRRLDGRIIHSIDGENVARGVLGFFELIFFAVSALPQKRVICRPPEYNFNQQLVHTQTTISTDLIRNILSHTTPTENNNQRACSCRFGFDLCPMERVIECVVLSSLPTRGHFGSLAASGSLLVWCGAKCFFYGRFPTEYERPAFKVASHSP